jgi:hypothetical protein
MFLIKSLRGSLYDRCYEASADLAFDAILWRNMTALTDIEKENRLLIDFLEGDVIAHNEFPEIMMPRITRTALAVGKDLPEDIRKEIAQHTFQNLLLIPSANFNPARGTAWQFLIGQIWNAEKQVRASYGLPQRRKKKVLQSAEDPAATAQLPRVVSIDAGETINLPTGNCERNFEKEFFVRTVIRKAPKPLATALKLICFEDKTKEQAAKIVGLSRFQLHRQIANLRSHLMAA